MSKGCRIVTAFFRCLESMAFFVFLSKDWFVYEKLVFNSLFLFEKRNPRYRFFDLCRHHRLVDSMGLSTDRGEGDRCRFRIAKTRNYKLCKAESEYSNSCVGVF